MPTDTFALAPRRAGLKALPAIWRGPLTALAATWLALILVFLPDWRDMAAQWWEISTYNHILLVPGIVGWLVALRREQLLKLVPHAWWPGLAVIGGAVLMWVLGSFAGLSLARQLAAVIVLQGAALTLLGPRVSAALAFPLAYLLFLVPAGEELVPLLQLATARMTMMLLGANGTPALLEGVFITTPTGYFKVAEACSGIKFLVAMTAFAVLAANLCFRRAGRRIAFVAAALTVAVVANGVRAWGTIVIARYRGIEFASGFDHIFYGWIFFAVVIALVLALGWRWFDRAAGDAPIDAEQIARSRALASLARLAAGQTRALVAIAGIVFGGFAWAAFASSLAAPVPRQIVFPHVPGWQRTAANLEIAWEPLHRGADHRLLGRFARGDDAVDVSYALYASQGEGREAGGFGQGAVPQDSAWAWAAPAPSIAGGRGERLEAPGAPNRVAVTWYHSGGLTTGSNLVLKLANIGDKLLLRRRTTAVLIVSAEERPNRPADEAIGRFLAATGTPGVWMDRVAVTR